jgi:hypothetical protein
LLTKIVKKSAVVLAEEVKMQRLLKKKDYEGAKFIHAKIQA